jgi:signal transduction histidine kinase
MRRQLVFGAAAVTTTVAIAFLVPLALMVRTIAEDRALARAELTARSLAPLVAVIDDEAVLADAAGSVGGEAAQVALHLPDGRVLGPDRAEPADLAAAWDGASFAAHGPAGATMLVPVHGIGGPRAVVAVFVPAEALRRGVVRAWALLALLGAALVGLAVVLADRLAQRVVRPVRALAEVAHRLGAGELEARVTPEGPPEIAQVGRVTNRLADRIGELLAAEREMVADLSHRLRTPMTSLRLDVEQIPDRALADRLLADVERLERGVSDVIRQARRPARGSRRAVDLAAIVRERAAFWGALADEQGRAWEVAVPPGACEVVIDPADAADALDALLGNVFAHTPDGAACRIELAVSDRQALVAVCDQGPGFEADAVGRGVSAAGSTGLGLDIARRAAESTGGRLLIRNREEGGACVELHLPEAPRLPA